MSVAHVLGFPRIGQERELKFALEKFWRGEIDETALKQTGRELRARHWALQREAGLDFAAVGDFAWYDQVLNTLALLGACPKRFGCDPNKLSLKEYFVMARGSQDHAAMEMTKWFDTNYHYLVPEFTAATQFDGGAGWLFDEVAEAMALGHRAKAVLVGPLTLLCLAKLKDGSKDKLSLLPRLLAGYRRILARLKEQGVEWVQMDEPALALDLDAPWLDALESAYETLAANVPRILLATYFDSVEKLAPRLKPLPVGGLHLDLVRAPEQLQAFLDDFPQTKVLSAGVVDGRNIWRAHLAKILDVLEPARAGLGERLWVAPSCSLLHVPVDLAPETRLDPEIKSWLAFAVQKLQELALLKRGLTQGRAAVAAPLAQSRDAIEGRAASARIRNDYVRRRAAALAPADANRRSPYATRIARQHARLNLPMLPTTTIGSFPQTAEIRNARKDLRDRRIGHERYLEAMRAEIRHAIEKQEGYGLDVLVHGEAERNDMVEYFGEQLWGFAFTQGGWVQSYGSRCVKPPIIFGDVYRPEPITVEWARYAQSLTAKPVKGMLTGPVTILQWSFARDDQPREATALQIALALRDEVCDLERAGIAVIQIDEPAFREGLPLKRSGWQHYLDWAVHAFRVASCGVQDDAQIHTHMCYSEFNDILPSIAALDADVITIETSRSDMELLDGFAGFAYPNDIGPGVYDIHSPRTPRVEDILRLLRRAQAMIPAERLWVNPDCGLKTRSWKEVDAALASMVEAARIAREAVHKPESAVAAAN